MVNSAAIWTVYGLNFTTSYPFKLPLHNAAATAAVDFHFHLDHQPLWSEEEWNRALPVDQGSHASGLNLYMRKHGDEYWFQFTWPESGRANQIVFRRAEVRCFVESPALLEIVELLFL